MHARSQSSALIILLFPLSLLAQDPLLLHHDGQSAFDRFGAAVSGAGDVNHDGYGDFVVGSPNADIHGRASGRVQIFSGADGALLRTFDGASAGDRFGAAVAGAGDVDHDGCDDIIVGAPQSDENGGESGSAFVFSGRDGFLLRRWVGAGARAHFGHSVAGAGDLDGDGFADVIIGAPGEVVAGMYDYEGTVRVLSGRTGAVLYYWDPAGAGDTFGWSVAGGVNLDGDGVPDILVGAPQHLRLGEPGFILGLAGASGALIGILYGIAPGDNFGWSVAGDRFGHLAVGARLSSAGGFQSGEVRVFLQGQPAADPLTGSGPGDYFGWSVSAAGDVNGDGFSDFIMGAPEHAGSPSGGPGYARIYSGRDWSLLRTLQGQGIDSRFGYAVAGVGDANRDGLADIIVGAPQDSRVSPQMGRIELPFLCGARTYGASAGGFNTLSLSWQAHPSPPGPGILAVSGGTANAPLDLFVSTGAGYANYGPITILIDVTPGASTSFPFVFNASGGFTLPVDLTAPSLPPAWRSFVQALQQNSTGFVALSNGLDLLSCH